MVVGSFSACLNLTMVLFFRVVVGYDEGTIMINLGHEEPVATVDSSGKIILAKA